MAVRIRQLDAYTLYATNVAASGTDWEATLGEFKGLQRALNANYPRITQQRVVVDGRLGTDTLREALRFGKVDLQWLADNARMVATDVAAAAGVKPNFSPSVLLTDYRGGTASPSPTPPPILEPPPPAFEPEDVAPEPEDVEPEPEPEDFEPEPEDRAPPPPAPSAPAAPSGGGATVWALGAVAAGLAGYALWRRRHR